MRITMTYIDPKPWA